MKAQDLKNTILQLAVQGKLVEQDPNDEPASVLLERIREERAELVKQKKVKAPKGGESIIYREGGSGYECRGKSDPVCIDEEIPFEIPEGWEWVRAQTMVSMISGTSYKKGDIKQEGIRVIRGGNIDVPNVVLKDDDVFLNASHRDIEKSLKCGDIVIVASTGSSTDIGRAGFVIEDMPAVQIGAFLRIIRPVSQDVVQLLRLVFESDYYRSRIRLLAKGTNINNVKEAYITEMLIPLPPLAEQRRIVAKVDELMPLVEKYGELEDAREALDAALPDRLRKSVLQLAVEGKLVEQDPNDEQASVLLERIREERAQLIKEKKIKKPKGGESVIYCGSNGFRYEKRGNGEPVCIDDEIPFEIPESWEWARLGSVVNIVSARRVHQSDWKSSGIPFYRAREIVKLASGDEILDPLYISEELYEKLKEDGVPKSGDLMVTGVGTIGTSYIVKEADLFYYKDASVLCFENRYGIYAEYLQLALQSPDMTMQIRNASSGTTVATITMKNAVDFVLPIPPLAEQRRIVAKVDEILSLIDG